MAGAGVGAATAFDLAGVCAFAQTAHANSSMNARRHVGVFIQNSWVGVFLAAVEHAELIISGAEKNLSLAGSEDEYLPAVSDLPSL